MYTSNRYDAWSEKEDEVLAKIVFRFAREGKTQRDAFEQAAYRLGRTQAACSYRWNTKIAQMDDNREIFTRSKTIGKKRKNESVEAEDKRYIKPKREPQARREAIEKEIES